MMKQLFFLLVTFTSLAPIAVANSLEEKPTTQLQDPAQFQQVIEEYKKYVAEVPAEVRDEIIQYRKTIAKLNKQKQQLYQRLTQDAQEYLQKTQEYKERLPLKRKNLLKIEVELPNKKS